MRNSATRCAPSLSRLDVAGFDLVEVNPVLDVGTGATAYLGAHTTIEFLGHICDQPRWIERRESSAVPANLVSPERTTITGAPHDECLDDAAPSGATDIPACASMRRTWTRFARDIAFLGIPYGEAYTYDDIVNDQTNGPSALRAAS